jgi:hypothetical protein
MPSFGFGQPEGDPLGSMGQQVAREQSETLHRRKGSGQMQGHKQKTQRLGRQDLLHHLRLAGSLFETHLRYLVRQLDWLLEYPLV